MLAQILLLCVAWRITVVQGEFGFFDQMFGGHQQQQQQRQPAGGMGQWQAHSDAGVYEIAGLQSRDDAPERQSSS